MQVAWSVAVGGAIVVRPLQQPSIINPEGKSNRCDATRSEIPRWQERERHTVYCSTQFPDFAGKIEHAQRSTFVVSAFLTLGMFVQFPHSNVHKQLHDEQEANLATPAPSRLLGFHFCISVRRERSTQSQSRMNRCLSPGRGVATLN